MKICAVEGCGGKVFQRVWCTKHYTRWWRHGDPLAGGSSPGECQEFVLRSLDASQEQCLEWPYSKASGYGTIRIDGVMYGVHVVVATIKHGAKPTERHEVAHSCGNRACLNHRHLRWATRSENHMDKLLHGTLARGERQGSAKLTESQVLEIRELLAQGMLQREIANLYGVAQPYVSEIKCRKTWGWLEDKEERR